ncbi:SDR family oxidoreductase [Rhodohalobacter mucosus]|uniref:Short chain dehydrogenase n=1 Tax=Rhodohalobacter mucosus TaxID=2079485 RepID=A0A316TXM8_9BACT|nr:SDR family oxidoreductase [Rhodohalobacter mucosus]PWN08229.1 short chain dehydrogenase [Rhodohalobacter mucosus]
MGPEKKVIWITGASSGIGEALAYEFNKKGAHLILSSRRPEELERVKIACENPDESVRILPLDLADTQSLNAKTKEALSMFGSIDMLINNGGISQRAYAVNTSMETVRRIMEVNFFGTIALTNAVLPHMIEQNSGHIVVISSVMGKIGTRYRSAYAASKHALHGWFDCLRQEVYEHDIDVSLVCPGFVKTNVTVNALTGDGDKYNKMEKAQKSAMPADEFAKKLLPKLAKKKEEIYIGGSEILSVYVKRLSPRLLNMILKKVQVT